MRTPEIRDRAQEREQEDRRQTRYFGVAPVYITMGGEHVRIGRKFHIGRGGRWRYLLTDGATQRAMDRHREANAVKLSEGDQAPEADPTKRDLLAFRFHVARHDANRLVVEPVRRAVARLLPRWLMADALVRASRRILPGEEVPAVPFMEIFNRWCYSDQYWERAAELKAAGVPIEQWSTIVAEEAGAITADKLSAEVPVTGVEKLDGGMEVSWGRGLPRQATITDVATGDRWMVVLGEDPETDDQAVRDGMAAFRQHLTETREGKS